MISVLEKYIAMEAGHLFLGHRLGNKLVTEIKILLRVILRLCNYIELVQFKELIQQVQET